MWTRLSPLWCRCSSVGPFQYLLDVVKISNKVRNHVKVLDRIVLQQSPDD
jgi:hypothetical protein